MVGDAGPLGEGLEPGPGLGARERSGDHRGVPGRAGGRGHEGLEQRCAVLPAAGGGQHHRPLRAGGLHGRRGARLDDVAAVVHPARQPVGPHRVDDRGLAVDQDVLVQLADRPRDVVAFPLGLHRGRVVEDVAQAEQRCAAERVQHVERRAQLAQGAERMLVDDQRRRAERLDGGRQERGPQAPDLARLDLQPARLVALVRDLADARGGGGRRRAAAARTRRRSRSSPPAARSRRATRPTGPGPAPGCAAGARAPCRRGSRAGSDRRSVDPRSQAVSGQVRATIDVGRRTCPLRVRGYSLVTGRGSSGSRGTARWGRSRPSRPAGAGTRTGRRTARRRPPWW